MANPQLSVEISANIDNLTKNLQLAGKETQDTALKMTQAIGNTTRSFAIINNTKFTFGNSFKKELEKIPQTLPTVTKGINQASNALTNLGRVAQDAPFGFIGIQNNLNPLLESFGRLRAETGSVGGAFKALGSSLLGPAGIGIALSVVSAGILLYQQYQQKANKTTKEGADANKQYIDTLDQITAVRIKGQQNAQRELVDARLLFNIYQNANEPLKDRQNAYKELQKQYPGYFKNIAFEQNVSAKTKGIYDELTSSILASARARAASEQLTKNAGREFENENKRIDARIKLQDAERKKRTAENFLSNIGSTAEFSQVRARYEKEIAGYSDTIAENSKIIRETNSDTSKLTDFNLRLEKLATGEKKKQLETTKEENKDLDKQTDKIAEIYKKLANELKSNPLVFGATKGDIADDNIKSYQNAIEGLISNGYNPASKAVQDLIDKQKALVVAFREAQGTLGGQPITTGTGSALPTLGAVNVLPKLNITEQQKSLSTLRNDFNFTDEEITKFVSNYGLSLTELVKVTQDFNKGISDVLNSGAITAISGIGEAIGNSLANGTSIIEAVGKGLLSSFGDILVQLGQVAIQTGIGIGAIKTALKSLNPIVAIAAGVGLIAIGTLIKGKVSNIGSGNSQDGSSGGKRNVRQFASGVNNFSGGMALVGERGPELVNLPTGSSVVNNTKTMDMLSQSRGDLNISLEGGMKISASELYLFIKKGEKEVARRGYNG